MHESPPLHRVLALCALAFLVLASYAVARPATESLFLEAHGSDALPQVWIAVALVSTLVVSFYNRYASSVGLLQLFQVCAALSAGGLALLLGVNALEAPGAAFALYVWKDVYIVILIELFWSYANTAFQLGTARWIYGLFCMMGSFGGMAGNLGVGKLAAVVGTSQSLWLVLPLLALTVALAWGMARWFGDSRRNAAPADLSAGFRVLLESRYLMWMLGLIAVVQVVITLVDYQFNVLLEEAYQDTDERTAAIGRVYAAIDVGSLALQAATGPVLRFIGVPFTLLGIPLMLGACIGAAVVSPRFASIAVAKVASKCFDYSLFRAAKEILYLPLGYEEKTQGKALVDMLTYRVAKGGVSILLLVLIAVKAGGWVLMLALALLGVWLFLVRALTQRWRARTEQAATDAPEGDATPSAPVSPGGRSR